MNPVFESLSPEFTALQIDRASRTRLNFSRRFPGANSDARNQEINIMVVAWVLDQFCLCWT